MRNSSKGRRWVGGVGMTLLIATAAMAQTAGPDKSSITTLRDIEYVPGGHERQKLDLYLPKTDESRSPAKRPLIVWIHGGAWLAGSKDDCPAVRFVHDGYAVASINYRLSQHAVFPAQIQDCKAAIRWLRANADKYGIDPDRFGVWGASAGGSAGPMTVLPGDGITVGLLAPLPGIWIVGVLACGWAGAGLNATWVLKSSMIWSRYSAAAWAAAPAYWGFCVTSR